MFNCCNGNADGAVLISPHAPGSDCRIDCNNTGVGGKLVMSVELITDANVTDGSVTGVGNAIVHTGLLTGVVSIDI